MEQYMGKDGSRVVILSDDDFNNLVEKYRMTLDEEPWYLEEDAQAVYRTTGLGYYPNGVTIGDTIYIRYRFRGDWELIAHEYGHILGHDHTNPTIPTMMNPIHQMRVTDPHNLKQRAKENYPELFRKHVSRVEASRNMAIGGIAAAFAYAWLR